MSDPADHPPRGEKTILLARKDMTGSPLNKPAVSASFTSPADKTINLDSADIQPSNSDREPLEDTVSLPLSLPAPADKPPKRKATRNIQQATQLEKEYYQEVVRKNDGSGKYHFLEEIVAGGMGAIFKVQDSDLQRINAMKVILPAMRQERGNLDDFVAEAKITGFLEHPNIIPVHELGLLNATGLFFTMKLAHGQPLNTILAKLKDNDPVYAEKYNTFHLLRIFSKVCDALAFAHSKKFIHQDIKPHNIMIGHYGEVLLMDWGLGRYIGDPDREKDPGLREIVQGLAQLPPPKEEMIKGSPPYMSPEQTQGDPSLLDERSDIFLLGATLYHIFTLHPPYMAKDVYEILYKAESGEYAPPELRNPSRQIPKEICRIIKKAMALKKEDRYQSVNNLSRDVDDVISGKWTQEERKVFPPGALLMKEGDPGEEAYLILSGKVEVFKEHSDKRIVLGTSGQGDIVGEMALIAQEPRSASVVALEPTETAVLTSQVLNQNLEKLPPFMGKIIQSLAERLKSANTLINPHSISDSTYFILEQLRLIFKDKSIGKINQKIIPLHVLVREISENLGIAESKVSAALKKAAEQKYITVNNGQVAIPDINELTQYTRFGKLITKLPPERQELVFDSIRKKR